jgi:hypothetical protein
MQFPPEMLNLPARRREAKAVTIAEQGAWILKRNFQVFAKTLPTRFNTVLAAHAQAMEYNTASKQFKTVSVLRHGCLEVVAAPLSVDVAKLTEP